jgi:1,4-alpha-glucan branching enzyme
VAGTFNSWNMTNSPLVKESDGYWSRDVSPVEVGAQYKYVINNTLWKRDPRSLKVTSSSGESVVFDPDAYQWDIETFTPPARKDMVVYAMHVLTYNPGFTLSPYGNFGMAINKLDHLQSLGVNVVN